MIRVLFFSILRDLTGTGEVEFPIGTGGETLGELINRLYLDYPVVQEWDAKLLLAVNGEFAERDQLVNDGDELALMPPVQGG